MSTLVGEALTRLKTCLSQSTNLLPFLYSYYNWKTQVSTSNSSPNFEVIYDDPNGLLFKNKRDKKILNVDPMSGPGEDSNRTFLQSDLYIHVVIYDHNIRTV
ncbi:hypothetical protein F7725_013238 [Dissostichus mawsoni]|uniref:Cilia- and flagella-associated protein 299 n=1 Tax=Dissostichus mawsoni TaxID=36200 RepID=A0A7J5YPN7_DISMA|nr:hypothetical protein F7725_013238 [Dissostichus mawsoni]